LHCFKSAGKLIDTVSINADLLEVEMLPQGSPALMYLEKKKLLPARHHYYSIRLHSNNCDVDYWLTCADNSEEARLAINKNTRKVKLTCAIFRDHKLPGNVVPFVVVTKLRTD
jgi:hypothetical protein